METHGYPAVRNRVDPALSIVKINKNPRDGKIGRKTGFTAIRML